MTEDKTCVGCGTKDAPRVMVEPIGYFCSNCIETTIDKLNEAHDNLYKEMIFPAMSKKITKLLDEPEFDLENYIENNPYFSEQVMFNVVTDMIESEKNKDVVLRLMDGARIKSLGMEFVDYDE